MISDIIIKLINNKDLTFEESYGVMKEIMSGTSTSTQNVAFLTAFPARIKV